MASIQVSMAMLVCVYGRASAGEHARLEFASLVARAVPPSRAPFLCNYRTRACAHVYARTHTRARGMHAHSYRLIIHGLGSRV